MARSRDDRSNTSEPAAAAAPVEAESAASDQPAAAAARSRTADAATVGWMLSLLATLGAELLTVVGILLVEYVPQKDEAPGLLQMIPGSFGFTALATGAVCLILTPIVHQMRTHPPPLAIEIAAVVIGGIPWLLLGVSLVAKVAQ